MVRRLSANPLGFLALLVASALLLSFAVAIAGRGVQMYNIRQDEARLQREVNELEARNAALRAQKEFYSSDYYVERVAREELGLVKPDDLSVIVVRRTPAETSHGPAALEVSAPAPAAAEPEPDHLAQLRDWLLGR